MGSIFKFVARVGYDVVNRLVNSGYQAAKSVVSSTYNIIRSRPEAPPDPQELADLLQEASRPPESLAEPQEARDVLEIEQVYNRRLLGNAIAHYEIQNHTSTSPTDFLNNARGLVTDFFRAHPNNKFQISLTFIVIKVDAQGSVVAEEETGRSSKQEVVFPATDVEEVYDRMRDKIIESFANYMRNRRGS